MSESTANITNATFLGNSAAELGTVVIETNSNFQCFQCYFYNNYAYDSSGIFAYNNKHTNVDIINSKFVNNTSDGVGGALKWNIYEPNMDTTKLTFKNNKASVYGNNIAAVSR